MLKLLERLCKLKQLRAEKGVPAYCENCQHPITAAELLECAPSEGLWVTWQALQLCPRCAPK